MISLELLVSSVLATSLALVVSRNAGITARFRHAILWTSVVLVPAGSIAAGAAVFALVDSGVSFGPTEVLNTF